MKVSEIEEGEDEPPTRSVTRERVSDDTLPFLLTSLVVTKQPVQKGPGDPP